MALPPSDGAAKETVSCALPEAAVGWEGADGTVLGIAAADGGDAGPVPFAFVAATAQVYDFPFVRPTMTTGEVVPAPDPVAPPFEDVHVTP